MNSQTESSPAGILERVLAAIDKVTFEVLATDMDVHKPLESYGIGSLALIDLIECLNQAFATKLSNSFLYSYTTIDSIVKYFEAQSATVSSATTVAVKSADISDTDIAIVGISCRFPGDLNGVEDFWDCIDRDDSVITENQRPGWLARLVGASSAVDRRVISTMGVIKEYDYFDPSVFGLSVREVNCMDPQQRLSLEQAWSALEDANINPLAVEAIKGGIFVGAGTPDYAQVISHTVAAADTLLGTGTATSILAGRIAYLFNWCGPAVVIDTACSSSLVAVHQACEALISGSCELALAGAVNVILSPTTSLLLHQSQALSPSGKCRPFSDKADGYVRSEGCGFVVLKPLKQALKDKDRIYAVIKGSAINQDGRSQGMTAPNGRAQREVMEQGLLKAGMKADAISFIESHGTGTPLGDPVELESIQAIYGDIDIGTLKANIGHTESAAGISSLIKCVHMLSKDNKFTALNCFGFSGTNVHMILGQASEPRVTFDKKPTTNFNRQRYPISGYDDYYLTELGERLSLPDNVQLYQIKFDANYPERLSDHCLQQQIIIPGAFYLSKTFDLLNSHYSNDCFSIEKIKFSNALSLQPDDNGVVQWHVKDGEILIFCDLQHGTCEQRCSLRLLDSVSDSLSSGDFSIYQQLMSKKERVYGESYYEFLAAQGVNLGKTFRGISHYWVDDEVIITEIESKLITSSMSSGLLDSVLQVVGIYYKTYSLEEGGVRIPVSIEQIDYDWKACPQCFCVLDKPRDKDIFDISVYSELGHRLLVINGLKIVRVSEKKWINSYNWRWQPLDIADKQVSQPLHRMILNIAIDEIEKLADRINSKLDNEPVLLIIDLQQSLSIETHTFSSKLFKLVQELLLITSYERFQLQVYRLSASSFIVGDALLGCLKTLSLECPQLKWLWVNTDEIKDLTTLSWRPDEFIRETTLKFYDGQYWSKRLQRYTLSEQRFHMKPDECLVIVGGNSHIAQALIPLMAMESINVILIQRQPSQQPNVYVVDALSENELLNVFNKINNLHGKIAAVFHLIGAHAEGLMSQQTEEGFDTALFSKVQSAWCIHHVLAEHFRDTQLVLFSSAACVFGGMGQGSYAGSNQYLHALADLRMTMRLPVTVIAWGDWLLEKREIKHMIDIGMKSMTPQQCLDIIWRAMAVEYCELAAFSLNWEQLAAMSESRHLALEFQDFIAVKDAAKQTSVLVDALKRCAIDQRKQRLDEELRKILSKILGFDKDEFVVDRLLSEYGLESITSLELRESVYQQFSVTLPIAQLFDRLTVSSLCEAVMSGIDWEDASSPIKEHAFVELENLLLEDEL